LLAVNRIAIQKHFYYIIKKNNVDKGCETTSVLLMLKKFALFSLYFLVIERCSL